MLRAKILIAAIAFLLALLVTFASCGPGGEEEDDNEVPPFEDDDDDPMGPPGGEDDDDDDGGDDDDDDDWPEEACNGDSEPHSIIYTTWDMLSTDMQDLFITAFEGTFEAKDFHGRFVYWYGVAREGCRSLRDYYKSSYPEDRWTEETTAARIAVSYMRKRGELLNIGLFHSEVVDLYNQLDSPVPPLGDPEQYFNNNEADILASTSKYLWYQLHWAKEALGDAEQTDFGELLAVFVCQNIDADAEFEAVIPHSGFEDWLLAERVLESMDDDLRTWFLRLDPQIEIVAEARSALITYE